MLFYDARRKVTQDLRALSMPSGGTAVESYDPRDYKDAWRAFYRVESIASVGLDRGEQNSLYSRWISFLNGWDAARGNI